MNGLKNLIQNADPALYVQIGVYAIIILYMIIAGIPDLVRLSAKRIWAISSVCFSESIRRRVLWIIPLALLGLVVVIQLQQSWDPQEDIRQATKFCLLTTGLVVVTSTLILACTSIPREIESRVIFTVVTKPTTRLEIILGKITGFARMSATILVIMGIFTFGYLHLRAWSLQRDIKERLRMNAVEAMSKPTFEHYENAGLLDAKSMANAVSMNIFQLPPKLGSRRYPTPDGMVLVPFKLPDDALARLDPEGKYYKGPGLTVHITAGYDKTEPTTSPSKPRAEWKPPKVAFMVLDPGQNTLLATELKGNVVDIPPLDAADRTLSIELPMNQVAPAMTRMPYFYIGVSSAGGDGTMWLDDDFPKNPPVQLSVPVADPSDASGVKWVTVKPLFQSVYKGRDGVTGQQVKGDPTGKSQVCVFRFQDLKVDPNATGDIPVEFKLGVEKSSEQGDATDAPTNATLTVYNPKTGEESKPITVTPENARWFYTSVPADQLKSGEFEIRVRCLSEGQWLNLKRGSLQVVQADHSFGWNLIKSLFILWLLSVLVTSIAVCCSTFLSWPIAVVLTLVILFAHWGVDELGDSANPGIGRYVAQDFGVRDPATMHVVSDSVEVLNKTLKQVSAVLPNIDKFSAVDDIDHGINITRETVTGGAIVLLAFGLPFSILAYIRLKNMEVAP
jgi:ABC-type transport system involved in multi-copper enzyme maturation permease subunit